MKKMKRLVLPVALMVFAMLALTGCKTTPQSLLQDVAVKTQKAKSYAVNMLMDVEMSGETMGTSFDVALNMDMDMDIIADPVAIHGKGKVKVAMLGEKQNMKMEMYQEQKGDKMISYTTQDGGTWVKTETDVPKDKSAGLGLGEFKKFYENFELEDKTQTINNEECYVIKGKVSMETLEGIMDSAMSGMGESKALFDAMDLEGQKLPIEFSISKKTKNPVRLSMDMTEFMTSALDAQIPGIECDKAEFVLNFNSFDKVDEIEIPKKVKSNAESSDDMLGGAKDSGEDVSDIFAENKQDNKEEKDSADTSKDTTKEVEPTVEPAAKKSEGAATSAQQASELGNEWSSFNVLVNGKVLTLPCTYEEMKATGFEMETEYSKHNEEYIINADDSEYVTFADPDSEYSGFSVELANNTDQPMKIKDSLVVGITISDYSLEDSNKKIILPANVEVGQDINTVIEAYGKPSSKTESNDTISCSWMADESYNKTLYISAKDGKIEYIALQNKG